MRVFIGGVDGYLGWSLALYLTGRGHEVSGCDLYLRRDWVAEMGSQSATPIRRMSERLEAFRERFQANLQFRKGDLCDYDFVLNCMRAFQPEAIVHLGEMPSAPYSMIDVGHCVFTHHNNLTSTLNILHAMHEAVPQAHLLKLGTMGEYGTPNIDIPEGFFEIEYRGRKDRLPFSAPSGEPGTTRPRCTTRTTSCSLAAFGVCVPPTSCRAWCSAPGSKRWGVTNGCSPDSISTNASARAINRFCAQAVIGHALTPFGKGHQKRGFLPLRDAMQCLTLTIDNPPQEGEYRVFNQFQEVYDLTELAQMVQRIARSAGLEAEIRNIQNPRQEAEEHYYNPDRQHLLDIGYAPTQDVESEITLMLEDLMRYRQRISARAEALTPDVHWDGSRDKVCYVDDDAGQPRTR